MTVRSESCDSHLVRFMYWSEVPMIAIVNCPVCKKRFNSTVEPPEQIDDEPAVVTLVCPHCKHEFQFAISGFAVND